MSYFNKLSVDNARTYPAGLKTNTGLDSGPGSNTGATYWEWVSANEVIGLTTSPSMVKFIVNSDNSLSGTSYNGTFSLVPGFGSSIPAHTYIGNGITLWAVNRYDGFDNRTYIWTADSNGIIDEKGPYGEGDNYLRSTSISSVGNEYIVSSRGLGLNSGATSPNWIVITVDSLGIITFVDEEQTDVPFLENQSGIQADPYWQALGTHLAQFVTTDNTSLLMVDNAYRYTYSTSVGLADSAPATFHEYVSCHAQYIRPGTIENIGWIFWWDNSYTAVYPDSFDYVIHPNVGTGLAGTVNPNINVVRTAFVMSDPESGTNYVVTVSQSDLDPNWVQVWFNTYNSQGVLTPYRKFDFDSGFLDHAFDIASTPGLDKQLRFILGGAPSGSFNIITERNPDAFGGGTIPETSNPSGNDRILSWGNLIIPWESATVDWQSVTLYWEDF